MNDISCLIKSIHFQVKLQDPKNVIDIKSFQNEIEKHQINQVENIFKLVNEVRKILEKIKSEVLKNFNKTFNANIFEKKLLEVKKKILNLKTEIKNELIKVIDDESVLFNDIKAVEKKLQEWEKPVNIQILKQSRPNTYKITNKNKNPSNEFQNFLLHNGGHNGGWLEHDHLLFLRERKKYKDKEKFLDSLQHILPDLSYDDIIKHENWYVKYETLKNSLKDAIQKWKEEKVAKENISNLEKKNNEENNKNKSNKVLANQLKIAERIKEWKKQQLCKKIEEEERMKQEKKNLYREKIKIKEINKKKKIAVDQYKAEKLSKIQEDLLNQQKKNSQKFDKTKNHILLQSFRLQDIKFLERKKNNQLRAELKCKSKIEKLNLNKASFDFLLPRDPERVFKPTAIWTLHCLPEEKKEKPNQLIDLNKIPHLMIPEWRRELK